MTGHPSRVTLALAGILAVAGISVGGMAPDEIGPYPTEDSAPVAAYHHGSDFQGITHLIHNP